MGNEPNWEHHPGVPPENPWEEIKGLEEAIEATKKRIEEYKANSWDTSEFETHLNGLEQRLKKAQEKIQKAA